jgi:hypothetical protein
MLLYIMLCKSTWNFLFWDLWNEQEWQKTEPGIILLWCSLKVRSYSMVVLFLAYIGPLGGETLQPSES